MRYKTVQLPVDMVKRVKQIIDDRPELGYVSVKGFVEDSVRRRLEQMGGKRGEGDRTHFNAREGPRASEV
jgi:hypothetical protein